MIPRRGGGSAAGIERELDELTSLPVLLVPGWGAPHLHTRWIAWELSRRGMKVETMRLPNMAVGDMNRSAELVSDEVDRIMAETGADRVSLVGYSLGGLIARIYLQDLRGYQKLGRAVFVGAPQDGIYTGYAALFTKAGRQVSKGSVFMRNLNRSRKCGCDEARCLAIYLMQDGTIFPAKSARLRCGYNLELMWPVLHWGLVFNPQVIAAAVRFLKGGIPPGAVPGAKECVPRGRNSGSTGG